MIGRTNAVIGGGNITKSVIIVTAPTGSTVTCTNDSAAKKACEKSGTWIFGGLDKGNWTIHSTLANGASFTKIVNVAEGENSYFVQVTYDLNLLSIPEAEWTTYLFSAAAEWQDDGSIKLTKNFSANGSRWTILTPLVDLTKYKTLKLALTHVSGNTSTTVMGITKQNEYDNAETVATTNVSESGEYTLDVSALNGDYYCGLYCLQNNSQIDLVTEFKLI